MKFLPLVWKGVWRKRTRAVLILLQVVIAFTLFGVLQGLNTIFNHAIARSRADHLYVASQSGAPLPLAHLEKIRRVPGVAVAYAQTFITGTYQLPTQIVTGQAIDLEVMLRADPGVHVPEPQVRALSNTRDGAIVGAALAAKYGFKIGDRLPLKSRIVRRDGSGDWSFQVVGFYAQDYLPETSLGILLNYSYLNESRVEDRDTVDLISVIAAGINDSVKVSQAIDELFANSRDATRSQSEIEALQAQIQGIADVAFLAHAITGAAFIGLLLATSTLMMQSIRERIPELGVLKAIGFSDGRVMSLILAEALMLCLAGAAVGLWIAAILVPRAKFILGGVGPVPGIVIVAGLGCAGVLALASASVPAWRGLRLQVAQTMSR